MEAMLFNIKMQLNSRLTLFRLILFTILLLLLTSYAYCDFSPAAEDIAIVEQESRRGQVFQNLLDLHAAYEKTSKKNQEAIMENIKNSLKDVKIFDWNLFIANLVFAFLSPIGQMSEDGAPLMSLNEFFQNYVYSLILQNSFCFFLDYTKPFLSAYSFSTPLELHDLLVKHQYFISEASWQNLNFALLDAEDAHPVKIIHN